jgi:hypothetical protein
MNQTGSCEALGTLHFSILAKHVLIPSLKASSLRMHIGSLLCAAVKRGNEEGGGYPGRRGVMMLRIRRVGKIGDVLICIV